MHKFFKISLAAMAALAFASPAFAGAASFRADANSTKWIDLTACSPQVRVEVTGDTDTDLDFEIYNPGGQRVFTDNDYTDYTWTTLNTGIYRNESICRIFKLKVTNHGDIYNMFRVSVN